MNRTTLAAAAGATALALAIALAIALLFAPERLGNVPPQGGDVAGEAGDRPPIVLYLVDTLRADRLGLYGYGGGTSPALDALAAESVVFEQAYGAAPWTLPSVASLFTSTFACEHGVTGYRRTLNPALPTLAEQLTALGYDTASWYSNIHAGAVAELNRGFRQTVELPASDNDRAADVATYLAAAGGNPWFLYLHTMEPHGWFQVPVRYLPPRRHVGIDERETLRAIWFRHNELRSWDWARGLPRGTTDHGTEQAAIGRLLSTQRATVNLLYDAGVRQADEHLGKVVTELKRSGAWDRAIFVLVSDHGEELGEHGGWFHDHAIYEEQLRVPFLVHFPGSEFAGRRISTPVSLVDVMPTLLDYLGHAERCTGCRGRSLLPLLAGAATADADAGDYIPALRANEIMQGGPAALSRGDLNVALRRGPWKGIWNDGPDTLELYDLVADPSETRDRAAAEPEVAAGMQAAAAGWLRGCARSGREATATELDERSRSALRALGYLN
jgi:arylsulfatase A-like enzyme